MTLRSWLPWQLPEARGLKVFDACIHSAGQGNPESAPGCMRETCKDYISSRKRGVTSCLRLVLFIENDTGCLPCTCFLRREEMKQGKASCALIIASVFNKANYGLDIGIDTLTGNCNMEKGVKKGYRTKNDKKGLYGIVVVVHLWSKRPWLCELCEAFTCFVDFWPPMVSCGF